MSEQSAAILGCLGPRLRSDERAFYADAQPWGFILFARNLETPDQVKRLTDGLRDAVGRDAPILIDQEGGRVQRLGPPHWRQFMPPLDQMAAAGENGPRSMELRAMLIAQEHVALGIDVNCSPMADIAEPGTHPVLKNRCYGSDAGTVIAAAKAVARGLRAGGVSPVLKHIPGHGRAFVDSHLHLPVVEDHADILRARDFAPFKALSDLKMGMSAHLVFTAFDAERPATQSPVMIDLIRNEIGFGGLLMTDDISMEALDGSLAERATASLQAGCDMVLHCNGELPEMKEIVAASGRLDGKALARAEAALCDRPERKTIDIKAIEAELDALLDGKVYG